MNEAAPNSNILRRQPRHRIKPSAKHVVTALKRPQVILRAIVVCAGLDESVEKHGAERKRSAITRPATLWSI